MRSAIIRAPHQAPSARPAAHSRRAGTGACGNRRKAGREPRSFRDRTGCAVPPGSPGAPLRLHVFGWTIWNVRHGAARCRGDPAPVRCAYGRGRSGCCTMETATIERDRMQTRRPLPGNYRGTARRGYSSGGVELIPDRLTLTPHRSPGRPRLLRTQTRAQAPDRLIECHARLPSWAQCLSERPNVLSPFSLQEPSHTLFTIRIDSGNGGFHTRSTQHRPPCTPHAGS